MHTKKQTKLLVHVDMTGIMFAYPPSLGIGHLPERALNILFISCTFPLWMVDCLVVDLCECTVYMQTCCDLLYDMPDDGDLTET